jgi:hypothetical protein
MQYDVIGDIHGHADELAALLGKMGYREQFGAWRHPGRQAVFVGDFIDRGPKQVDSVLIARRMVDAGTALAVMGNHEFNAIGWYTPNPARPEEHLRRHTPGNHHQHEAFLNAVQGSSLHREIIDWFKTLPLWLELPGLNIVHACWHEAFMAELAPRLGSDRTLPESLYSAAFSQPDVEASKDTADFTVFKALEALTKGMEVDLPHGRSFLDADGHRRTRVRVQWWRSGHVPYRDAAEATAAIRSQLADVDPALAVPSHATLGYARDVPVLFGHYWRTDSPAVIDGGRLACIDYSVAKGGQLVAYRWEGEPWLVNEHFVSV